MLRYIYINVQKRAHVAMYIYVKHTENSVYLYLTIFIFIFYNIHLLLLVYCCKYLIQNMCVFVCVCVHVSMCLNCIKKIKLRQFSMNTQTWYLAEKVAHVFPTFIDFLCEFLCVGGRKIILLIYFQYHYKVF